MGQKTKDRGRGGPEGRVITMEGTESLGRLMWIHVRHLKKQKRVQAQRSIP